MALFAIPNNQGRTSPDLCGGGARRSRRARRASLQLPRVGSGILEGVAEDESSKADEREKLSPTAADRGQKHSFGQFGPYVPQDILDVSFPVAVRGYDRRAVDAYRERVNRVIPEL